MSCVDVLSNGCTHQTYIFRSPWLKEQRIGSYQPTQSLVRHNVNLGSGSVAAGARLNVWAVSQPDHAEDVMQINRESIHRS